MMKKNIVVVVVDATQAIEEGVNHMWTVSAFQQHARTLMICDEDATLDLKVRTVKYFKDLWDVHSKLTMDNNLIGEEVKK
jgi:glucosamine-6-phosphate deaminase